MTSTGLFLFSIALSCAGALLSLAFFRSEGTSKVLGCFFGILSALAGAGSGLSALTGSAELTSVATPFSFADFSLMLNPLSGLLMLVISLLALAAWIYGLNYFDEYKGHGLGTAGFFMNLFVASMGFVICVDNAFWFLVFFELMSLTSYFLVVIEQNESSIKGGFLYLIMAHVGFFLIMIAFFVMYGITGSFEFESFRHTAFSPAIASLVFVLCFVGFGCKAGMVPFHSWLPQAHPAAPSNVSALMSGGMIKIGVFGMVKVGLDMLQSCNVELWWGVLVLVFGAVSSVLGVVYALNEHDIKRLLAYHSVENIGIILLGVGTGFIGLAVGNTPVAVLGFLAGFYHLLNHAMFKGLLFLGAGSVLYSTGTRNMEAMGGLARVMPVTALCFLIGSLAISAIPPLNGFVSEWFTYQSMITVAFEGDAVVKAFAAFGAVSLAITGALAVTCFVKAYGVTFLSAPRSAVAAEAKEVPGPMRFGMILIAAICVFLGVGAPAVAPVMQNAAAAMVKASSASVVSGASMVNATTEGVVSTPLIAVLLIGAVALAWGLRSALSSSQAGVREDPWACGYQPNAHMPVIATSFASQVDMVLGPLYRIRTACASLAPRFVSAFGKTVEGTKVAETLGDRYIVDTAARFVDWVSAKVQRIEGGDFRSYILYIVVALVALLALAVFK
ncbi:hydrogenase 4 subunit B [Berryella intestinalis]|uniref:Hydrogenase 4 subunit B n=1 Tax=Berryella intestinalis TaxID=1531429 RepID=A0A0A8B2A7_9ACTN|nr:hydrogenase 4 subunit B [Berryella intestinalis]AJC11530.1 hydrogenase 4 subunit B [Berryella intestinalis]